MNSLQFCLPQLDAFLSVLTPVWKTPQLTARLIGDNPLALELAHAAQQQGITLRHEWPIEAEESGGPQWLIFTETDGERLAEQLLACVGLNQVSVLAPITDRHFSRRPLFLISIPKSGTHLLYELARALGYHEGVVLPEFPLAQTWYCVEYSNSHTVAADFFVDSVRRARFGNRHHPFMSSPALFLYRHPLDVLVSEAHYYERDGKTAFAGWLSGLDLSGRIARLLDDNWLLGSLRQRIGGFLPWLDFPNVASLSFEELIGAAGGGSEVEQLRLIWSLQLKLQAPGAPATVAASLFNRDAATFRAGQIGGFHHTMAPGDINRFIEHNQDLLATLGYPQDGRIDLPANCHDRQATPLRYATETFDAMPILVEEDFLGCNLVRFQQRLYALPLLAGSVSLQACTEAQRKTLPSATTLNELKALLLLGKDGAEEQRAAQQRLTHRLIGDAANGPPLVTTYNGFNVFHLHQRYLGLRQTLGPTDLRISLPELLTRYPTRDVMTGNTLAELIEHIDGVSMAMRLEAAREDLGRDVQERVLAQEHVSDELRQSLEHANKRLAVLEQELQRLKLPWWRRV